MCANLLPMEISKETNINNNVYEVGYLLLSSIPEEKVQDSVEKITSVINKEAKVISQGAPELIDLSYTMSIKSEGKRDDYNSAYFGWIKFESEDGEVVVKIKEEIDKTSDVLRFILVKTLRDDNLTTPKNVIKKKRDEINASETSEDVKEVKEGEDIEESDSKKKEKVVDEKKIDETIDNLVIE